MHIFHFQMQIGLPITGKYRDPESDQYYNHSDVRKLLSECPLSIQICFQSIYTQAH